MKRLIGSVLIALSVGCNESPDTTVTGPSSIPRGNTFAVVDVVIPTGPNSCPDGSYPSLTVNMVDTSALFLWTPIENIDVYDFEVERLGDFNEYVRQSQFRADPRGVQYGLFYTDWQIPTSEDSRYRVKIRTKNRCDVPGPWSPWVTFVFDGRHGDDGRPDPDVVAGTPPVVPVVPPPGLEGSGGSLSTYAMLAGSAITCTTSTVTGDIGVSPGTSITGFPGLCTLNGSIISTANAAAAKADLDATYTDAFAGACTPIAANLNGLILTPGTYCSGALTSNLTGTLTLSGAGLYIIRFPSTLITSPGSNVQLTNGAGCGDVLYAVGSSATLAGNLTGNVLAFSSITANPGSTTTGRLLARNAAVTITTATVTNAGCS